MRLLNASTLELSEFTAHIPSYAILSHTWGPEEVTFQEITSPERDKKKGFAKILGCCRQAQMDNLDWVWIDTCCIDKTSSAELSEAINSMYAWYRDAEVCYAYLEDVPSPTFGFPSYEFRMARWFTRGWCLQELIAPRTLEFYAADWHIMGTKLSLYKLIQGITAIPESVLIGEKNALEGCCIAQKMSWASQRQTTRVEDEAYCLLGIFGVHMPMLYGEGERAFYRLQEEIIRQIEDYSFLLWTDPLSDKRCPVFAPRPANFHYSGPDSPIGRLDYRNLQPGLQRYQPGELSWLGNSSLQGRVDSGRSFSWAPSQMTGRGLRVFLPTESFIGRNRSRSKNLCLLWSGFLYQQRMVCVFLVQDDTAGPECYLRAGAGLRRLHLLKSDRITTLNTREIYLRTRSTAWEAEPRSYAEWDNVDLDVVLPSLQATTITIGKCNQALQFHALPASHTGHIVSSTRVWRSHRRILLEGHCFLRISFEILTQNTPSNGGPSRHYIQVNIWFERGPVSPPKCSLQLAGEGGSLLPDPTRPDRDGAELTLPTDQTVVTYVKRVKRSRGLPRTLVILRVDVLEPLKE